MGVQVLLVEDDRRLAGYTVEFLEQRGFTVIWACTAAEALRQFSAATFDVVLLDLTLPGMDGLELARTWRQTSEVPILMVTARGEPDERLLGFQVGADDYLAKPYDPRELVARIQAIVKRAAPRAAAARVVRTGELEVHLEARSATLAGKPLELTSQEFELLRALAERLGTVLTRDALLEVLRGAGADEVFDRAIDVTVSRLRQKLEPQPRQPVYLKTVRNLGYMLARWT